MFYELSGRAKVKMSFLRWSNIETLKIAWINADRTYIKDDNQLSNIKILTILKIAKNSYSG